MIKLSFIYVLFLMAFYLFSCSPTFQEKTQGGSLYTKFIALPASDTIAIQLDVVAGDTGRVVTAAEFLSEIDPGLLLNLIYEPDTTDFVSRAYWQIPLDENHEACLLGIEQVWFKFKYLLIYDKTSGKFINILPAAYLYGGDGAQIMCESRLFDVATKPTLMTRFLDHSIRMSENVPGEVEDINIKSVVLDQWSNGEFVQIPVPDSSYWIQKYPLPWEE